MSNEIENANARNITEIVSEAPKKDLPTEVKEVAKPKGKGKKVIYNKTGEYEYFYYKNFPDKKFCTKIKKK